MLSSVTNSIAKIVVDLALDREFDYRIPLQLAGTVHIGSRVAVPFGKRTAQGYVVGLADNSTYPQLKEIAEVIGKKPLLGDKILELTRWMGKYYCCPVELCVKCALPEVVRKGKISWKERQYVKPGKISPDDLVKLKKRAPKQARALEILQKSPGMFLSKLLKLADTDGAAIKKLAEKGYVQLSEQIDDRDPFAGEVFLPSEALVLTADQQKALELCNAAIDNPEKPVLIHGVTGSGKTEIYLQAIEHALHQGKDSIVLVPEIALTRRRAQAGARPDRRRRGTRNELQAGGSAALQRALRRGHARQNRTRRRYPRFRHPRARILLQREARPLHAYL